MSPLVAVATAITTATLIAMISSRTRRRSTALLGGLFPELPVAAALFTAIRARLAAQERDRGDVAQWVILVAIGVAMAVVVGTIVYNKVRDKANTITTDTPGTGNP